MLTLARSGAEPLTLVISSMPILTWLLPGLSLMGMTTRVWWLVDRPCTTVSSRLTGSLAGLKASKRNRAKRFQFLTPPPLLPKLSPAAKATLQALPPSSLLSTISGLVLSSMPVSLGTWPLLTLSRIPFWEGGSWLKARSSPRPRLLTTVRNNRRCALIAFSFRGREGRLALESRTIAPALLL